MSIDISQFTKEQLGGLIDEYERDNQELEAKIQLLLEDEGYRSSAVRHEVLNELKWHKERVAAQEIEIANLNREISEAVERWHATRKENDRLAAMIEVALQHCGRISLEDKQ